MKNIKKWEPGLHQLSIFVIFVSIFFAVQAVQGATLITGIVIAKQDNSVKVEFKPHKTAGPKSGDKVDFKTVIQGFNVTAGNVDAQNMVGIIIRLV